MRHVTRRTAFGFQRRMFKSERALLVGMTFKAGGIRAGRKSRLLEFEATVRVVTVAAFHRSFEDLVMKR